MSLFVWSPLLPGGKQLLGAAGEDGALLEMTIPTIINGRMLVAFVIRDGEPFCNDGGWTQIVDGLGADGIFLDVYAHPHNGLQGTTVSFLSLTEQEMTGTLLALDNVAGVASLIEYAVSAAYSSTTTPAAPTSESSDDNNPVVCLWSSSTVVTLTPPAAMTSLDTYTSAQVGTKTLAAGHIAAGEIVGNEPGNAVSSPASSGRAFTIVFNYEAPEDLTATRETIRDRMITLITAITPTIRSDVKFRHSQDEGAADFQDWAEANPAGALRRFQVRYDGAASPPDVSSTLESAVEATFVITVAYPTDAKAGPQWGRDRDDEIESDWHKIDYLVGIYGRGNFSGTNSCTPLGATQSIVRGGSCDFLVIESRVRFYLDVDG